MTPILQLERGHQRSNLRASARTRGSVMLARLSTGDCNTNSEGQSVIVHPRDGGRRQGVSLDRLPFVFAASHGRKDSRE